MFRRHHTNGFEYRPLQTDKIIVAVIKFIKQLHGATLIRILPQMHQNRPFVIFSSVNDALANGCLIPKNIIRIITVMKR